MGGQFQSLYKKKVNLACIVLVLRQNLRLSKNYLWITKRSESCQFFVSHDKLAFDKRLVITYNLLEYESHFKVQWDSSYFIGGCCTAQ